MTGILRKASVVLFAALLVGYCACKKMSMETMKGDDSFFDKSIVVADGRLTHSSVAFDHSPSKEIDEAWVDKAIAELRKRDAKDHFSGQLQQIAGQPVWNQSLVFVGGDGKQTIITPVYKDSSGVGIVNGAVFSFFEKNGKYNARILSRRVANKYFEEKIRHVREVGRATLNGLFDYFQTGRNDAENIQHVNTNTVGVLDDPTYHIYQVCFYVPVSVSAPSTVYFEKQCHAEVFFGTYSEWDIYYGYGTYIDPSFGYYETYDENEVAKAEENRWEREKIDTSNLVNNPCLKRLIAKLMDNPTNDWGKMVKEVYSIGFGTGSLSSASDVHFNVLYFGADTGGFSRTPHNGPDVGQTTITVNGTVFNNCSDLYAANTLIHEFTHGLMEQMLIAHNVGDSVRLSNYDTCFNLYVDWLYDQTQLPKFSNNNGNHEYMAGQLVDIMAAALAEFDDNNQSMDYYWCMTWIGLEGTKAYKYYEQHPMNSDSDGDHSSYLYYPNMFKWSYGLTSARLAQKAAADSAERNMTNNSVSVPHDWNNCY